MKTFKIILVKELKSMIRDPKIIIAMIIVPLILTGIMYAAMIGFMGQVAREAEKKGGSLVLVDMDHGNWTGTVKELLKMNGYRLINASSLDEAWRILGSSNALGALVIPKGFSENLSSIKPAHISVYTVIRSISILSFTRSGKVMEAVTILSKNLTLIVTTRHGVPKEFVEKPVDARLAILLKNKLLETRDVEAVIGGLITTVIIIPILVMILSGFIAQLSATSMAVEKEEKMLETLLSLPLSRTQLIAAKITAAAIIGFLGVLVYGGLYIWFFSSLTTVGSSTSTSVVTAGISALYSIIGPYTITGLFIALIGLVLFILGLAILLSLFVEDVRSAQIVSGYIVFPLAILVFISMFIDPVSMDQTTRLIVAAIPMINVGLIIPYGFIGDYSSIIVAVASSLVYAGIVIWFTGRVVSTEKVFTMRLFKKKWRLRRR